MANKVILSPQFTLQARDFLKGSLLAVMASVVPLIQGSISAGELTFNWKAIGVTALGAFVSYIAKNLFLEPAQVVTTYSTNEKATQVAENLKS